MARSKSRDTLVSEIAALQARLKAHDKAEAARLGAIAVKAGIPAIDISDEDLTREFEAIVARFQSAAPEAVEPKAKGRRDAGSADADARDEAA